MSRARVYVGNLNPKANEMHLTQVFAHFGTIENVWIARKVRKPCLVSQKNAINN